MRRGPGRDLAHGGLPPRYALLGMFLVFLDCQPSRDAAKNTLAVAIMILFMGIVAVILWRRQSQKDDILRALAKDGPMTSAELRSRGAAGAGIHLALNELVDADLVFVRRIDREGESSSTCSYALTAGGKARAEGLSKGGPGER